MLVRVTEGFGRRSRAPEENLLRGDECQVPSPYGVSRAVPVPLWARRQRSGTPRVVPRAGQRNGLPLGADVVRLTCGDVWPGNGGPVRCDVRSSSSRQCCFFLSTVVFSCPPWHPAEVRPLSSRCSRDLTETRAPRQYAGRPLRQGRTVRYVTLPGISQGAVNGHTAMHIFAAATG